jgi:hypothetical protein
MKTLGPHPPSVEDVVVATSATSVTIGTPAAADPGRLGDYLVAAVFNERQLGGSWSGTGFAAFTETVNFRWAGIGADYNIWCGWKRWDGNEAANYTWTYGPGTEATHGALCYLRNTHAVDGGGPWQVDDFGDFHDDTTPDVPQTASAIDVPEGGAGMWVAMSGGVAWDTPSGSVRLDDASVPRVGVFVTRETGVLAKQHSVSITSGGIYTLQLGGSPR